MFFGRTRYGPQLRGRTSALANVFCPPTYAVRERERERERERTLFATEI